MNCAHPGMQAQVGRRAQKSRGAWRCGLGIPFGQRRERASKAGRARGRRAHRSQRCRRRWCDRPCCKKKSSPSLRRVHRVPKVSDEARRSPRFASTWSSSGPGTNFFVALLARCLPPTICDDRQPTLTHSYSWSRVDLLAGVWASVDLSRSITFSRTWRL
jgi:hypothetical protein